jgi:four helix bundle protein
MRTGLDQLEERTKVFAINAIRLCVELETLAGLRQLTWQLIDAVGSVASNHRAMRRARSTREFAAKLQIVNEEIDESVLWLEIIQALAAARERALAPVLDEALQLRAIFARARSTTRQRYS